MAQITPCEPGSKVQPGLLVIARRREMVAALAAQLRELPALRCDPCPRLAEGETEAPCRRDALVIVDLLEIMAAPRSFPPALAESPLAGMAVVAFRRDGRNLISALSEDLIVHFLDLLHHQALAEMVDRASPAYGRLYGEMHRISAQRVRQFLTRVRDGDPLTRREGEILRLLAQGHGTREIQDKLGIQAQTVKNHMTAIFQKLGVTRRTEAVAHYLGTHRRLAPPPR